ncbi:MAG TPA: hypothetical protein VF762_18205 [Blastocatellia bacterium]
MRVRHVRVLIVRMSMIVVVIVLVTIMAVRMIMPIVCAAWPSTVSGLTKVVVNLNSKVCLQSRRHRYQP